MAWRPARRKAAGRDSRQGRSRPRSVTRPAACCSATGHVPTRCTASPRPAPLAWVTFSRTHPCAFRTSPTRRRLQRLQSRCGLRRMNDFLRLMHSHQQDQSQNVCQSQVQPALAVHGRSSPRQASRPGRRFRRWGDQWQPRCRGRHRDSLAGLQLSLWRTRGSPIPAPGAGALPRRRPSRSSARRL